MTAKRAAMRLICPGCGVYGTIETFASDTDARAVASMFGELQPDVAAAVQRYLRLHAPAQHAITWHKARGLLDELVPLIKSGEIPRKRRMWPAPAAAWIAAIDAMLGNKSLALPLKGHGYLLEIIAGEAHKAEGAAEEDREQQRRSGAAARSGSASNLAGNLRDAVSGVDEVLSRAHVRTATAMLVAHATHLRKAYRQEVGDDEARGLLKQFKPDVIDAAITAWRSLK